ncbi:uncharacterized protein LOC131952654 [Physella acuta]|uniref:uncharacterized protein LOC131952654 n=1 Tax=Physella acuta TaxID=109671 RepID=UPI0027DD16B5|nr:uncharacterized protein LOC131952654 [Physella acuta]
MFKRINYLLISSTMSDPDTTEGSGVKGWRHLKARSKSSNNFRNSAYYERFLFFEQAACGHVPDLETHPSQPNRTRHLSEDRTHGGVKVARSADCRDKPAGVRGLHSHGGDVGLHPHEEEVCVKRDAALHSPERKITEKCSPGRASRFSFFYGRMTCSLADTTPLPCRRRLGQNSSHVMRAAHTGQDGGLTQQSRTFLTSSPKVSPASSQFLPLTREPLLHQQTLPARRWLSSPDVSLPSLNLEPEASPAPSPHTLSSAPSPIILSSAPSPNTLSPEIKLEPCMLHVKGDQHSDYSADFCCSRSTSPGAFSDSALKEDFDTRSCVSYPQMSRPCPAPDSLPGQTTLSHSLMELTRMKSIASINLTRASSARLAPSSESGRRIHVIKSAQSVPVLPRESSPRLLDEWLTAVVKHQKESSSEQWAFPEDEPNSVFSLTLPSKSYHPACELPETTDVSNTQNITSTHSKSDVWSLPREQTASPHRPRPDVSLYSCTSSLRAYTVEKPADVSDKCCTFCCVFHKDRQCSHVHHSSLHDSSSQTDLTALTDRPNSSPQRFQTSDISGGKGAQTELFGSGIRICVTEEEGVFDDRQPAAPAGVTQGGECLAREVTLASGASPHYIFPSSALGLEDDAGALFATLSPRNSVGSICSSQSYKSSNADSAVDLGPPDDDHDFEYADFLARHDLRRFSSVSERAELLEEPSGGDVLNVEETPTLPEPSAPDATDLPATRAPLVPLRRLSVGEAHMSQFFPELSFEDLSKPKSQSLENLSTNHEGDFVLNTIPNHGTFSRFRPYKPQDLTFDLSPSQHTLTGRDKGHPDPTPPSSHQTQTSELDPPLPAGHGPAEDHPTPLQCTLRRPRPLRASPQHVIPELVISDHSEPAPVKSSGAVRPVFSLVDDENDDENDDDLEDNIELFAPISPSPTPSPTPEFDLLQVDGPMFRSASVASISSECSTCSTCTIMSDTERPRQRKPQSALHPAPICPSPSPNLPFTLAPICPSP